MPEELVFPSKPEEITEEEFLRRGPKNYTEVRTVSATGGEKGTKIERYDLIPVEFMRLLARHYGVGAQKYDDNNWRRGYEWSKSMAALMRHFEAFRGGEDIDEETGTPHIIAVAWHAATLSEFMRLHPDYDDRIKE